jgi:hypothetical protein
MTFETFVVGVRNGGLFFKMCVALIKGERIVRKCIFIDV